MPPVRRADTVAAAIFDALARDLGPINPGETGVLDPNLPAAPLGETPLLVLGEWLAMALVIVIGMIVERRRRPRD